MTITTELDRTDSIYLSELVDAHNRRTGPRVGDYVIWREDQGERVYRRIAHDWGDTVQTCDGGSFHLGSAGVSFSGSLHRGIPLEDLKDTGETRYGPVWIWHDRVRAASNGIDTVAPFRVYVYVGERKLRASLAMWENDTEATPNDFRHILHMFDATGFEIGNVSLDGYGEPVSVGLALRDWERRTGRMVLQASDVVTVQGTRATHYGVRVDMLGG